MPSEILPALLGQVSSSMVYVSPVKLILVIVSFTAWAAYAQWADKDAVAVNTYRIIWNVSTLMVGLVATAVLLLVPTFWLGLVIYWVVVGGLMLSYVIHRNGLVVEEDKVLTADHFKRMMERRKGGDKKEKRDVREKVRLTGADGEMVRVPQEEEEREQYGITQDLLFDLFWRRANVVEIAPSGEETKVGYMVDGVPARLDPLERSDGEAVLVFLKQVAGLSLEERRKPQRGKFIASIGESMFDVDVRTAGSTAGERMTLRVVGEEKRFKVDHLGFTEPQLELVRAQMASEAGVALLSAPKGQGLTTTIYSMTRSFDAFLQNIQTLEFDQEVEVENVTQHKYTPREDRKFSQDLLKITRTDPDILVVPEVRDQESAQILAEAGKQKQNVVTAVRANDVFEALKAWIAQVGDRDKAANSLALVTNQRLIRKLCEICREQYKPDPPTLKRLNMPPDTLLWRQPEPEYDKNGEPILCEACQGTGYVGRTGVFEVLKVDDELRQAIKTAKSLSEIQGHAVKQATMGLQRQAIYKVTEGVTSIQEVLRVLKGGGQKPKAQPAPAGSS